MTCVNDGQMTCVNYGQLIRKELILIIGFQPSFLSSDTLKIEKIRSHHTHVFKTKRYDCEDWKHKTEVRFK